MSHPEVRGELKYWGQWTLGTVGVDGFRLDAIKHIASNFFLDWITELEDHAQCDLFVVGEYWSYNIETLHWYAANSGGRMSLCDAPLNMNFHQASHSGGNDDMSRLLDGTLMQQIPLLAVTLVDNHDTQPLQSLESVVEAWFKPLAFAVILLRDQGYPCIFQADYYGADYTDSKNGHDYRILLPSHRFRIDRFLLARGHCAYGPQYDYLDHFNSIGWTRLGTPGSPARHGGADERRARRQQVDGGGEAKHHHPRPDRAHSGVDHHQRRWLGGMALPGGLGVGVGGGGGPGGDGSDALKGAGPRRRRFCWWSSCSWSAWPC